LVKRERIKEELMSDIKKKELIVEEVNDLWKRSMIYCSILAKGTQISAAAGGPITHSVPNIRYSSKLSGS
jgi:hypothetical protein